MFINLTEVLKGEEQAVSMQFTSAEVKELITEVSVGGKDCFVCEAEPVRFLFRNTGRGRAELEGEACFFFEADCDRCLKPVKQKIALAINKELWAPDVSADFAVYEEQPFMEGFQLNVEELLRSEIVTSWPMKILCKPDCKGICPTCGRDLNTGTCDCDTFVPDPRMAAIKDIFEADKEV